MTVTIFPEPRFSTETFTLIRSGTGSGFAESFEEHRQSASGHPHVPQRRLERVEETTRRRASVTAAATFRCPREEFLGRERLIGSLILLRI